VRSRMNRRGQFAFGVTVLVWVMVGAAAGLGAKARAVSVDPQSADFFETHVRPVLADNCYACHGPERQMAGVRLDSRVAMLKGGGHGPVLVPGDPEKSAIIRAIRYTGAVKMPPPGKLSDAAIQALTAWVKAGAPWPETNSSQPQKSTGAFTISEAQRRHWAFQPVRKPPLPVVKETAWPLSPIDAFVLHGLEARGLRPNPPADKLTLLRRATFDLAGLPPTVAEIDAFLTDRSPDAFAHVVDRLLASPRYGERWGRYWLDVARYADTKGYTFQEDSHYPYAFSYRDYVIRAFNEDRPYNQFIVEQLAADRLLAAAPSSSQHSGVAGSGGASSQSEQPPFSEEKKKLAAMGFLTVGRRFLNNRPDIIDDRIDVVCRGLMGLTVGCARCHDHKFDPIPTRDYYSLYGVFASSNEPDPVVISPPSRSEPYFAHQKQVKAAAKEVEDQERAQQERLMAQFRAHVADYMQATREMPGKMEGEARENWAREHGLNPALLQHWQHFLADVPPSLQPIFRPWLEDARRQAPRDSKDTVAAPEPMELNPRVARMLAGTPPAAGRELAQRYGALFAEVERHWRDLLERHRIGAALAAQNGEQALEPPKSLPDADEEALRLLLYGPAGPFNFRAEQLEPYYEASAREALEAGREKVAKLREASPPTPEFAMVLEDAKEPVEPHVLVRGNPGNPGETVPRQFPQIVAGEKRQPFREGSGRLEMARAIASPRNPLTARVIVNRVWLHHFGEGLVRTPADFGMRSDPPTHPELQDYLAARFVEMGWSIKKLHRLILLSRTYQMSSDDNPHAARVDPENRLLWRVNRQRLDLEALRDSLLAVSGRLDLTMGGPAVEITVPSSAPRRTVYGFIDRQNLQSLFHTFDFASPDTTNAQRHQTTIPQQALFMMNSPFMVEQARALAARRDVATYSEPERRIRYLYRLLFGRLPKPEEVSLGLRFLQSTAPPSSTVIPAAQTSDAPRSLSPWEQYVQVLLMTNEFAFVD
jgi:mono/diheme cytochrome c family protein